jgi:hypothetical protein
MIAFDYSYIDKEFKVKFKPVSRKVKSWKEELLISAQSIANSTTKTLYVLMSGGIDSEQVARIFLESKIDFKVLTMKHKNGTNAHDIKYATSFCKQYGIEQTFVELDAEHFFTIGFEKYVKQGYRSTNIYHYLQLFLIDELEKLGGFGVGGAGEQVYYTIDNKIHLRINPHYTLGMDYCKNNGYQHNLWFNLSTPEIYASYLNIDLVDYLLKEPEYFVNHHYASIEKVMIYHSVWPEMQKRNKYSGFEYLEQTIRVPKQTELSERFPDLIGYYFPIEQVKKELNYVSI